MALTSKSKETFFAIIIFFNVHILSLITLGGKKDIKKIVRDDDRLIMGIHHIDYEKFFPRDHEDEN